MRVQVTVCTTCKFAADRAFDAAGRSGGAILAEALEVAARNRPGVMDIVRHECLWACRNSCTVLIEAEARTGYLAGRFEAGAEAAAAIADWAAAYGQSADGTVAWRDWPDGIKGHFLARLPKGTQQ